jgi:hypothetical protein
VPGPWAEPGHVRDQRGEGWLKEEADDEQRGDGDGLVAHECADADAECAE